MPDAYRRAYLTAKKREERARHKAAGKQSVTVWCYPEDKEAVREYAARLTERREDNEKPAGDQ